VGAGVEAQDKAADGDYDHEEYQQGRSEGGSEGNENGGDQDSDKKVLKEKILHGYIIQPTA
jgi:hypothetical protein